MAHEATQSKLEAVYMKDRLSEITSSCAYSTGDSYGPLCSSCMPNHSASSRNCTEKASGALFLFPLEEEASELEDEPSELEDEPPHSIQQQWSGRYSPSHPVQLR